jgi:hypothetical protein
MSSKLGVRGFRMTVVQSVAQLLRATEIIQICAAMSLHLLEGKTLGAWQYQFV